MKRRLNRTQAIRKYCIQCSGGSIKEVKECTITNCLLYEFRMGENKTNRQLKLDNKEGKR